MQNWDMQRMAAAAASAVFSSIGTFFISSLGTTTTLALETGAGLFRVGMGLVQLVVQFLVFASVLYYLLALEIDPIKRSVGILPLSPEVRRRQRGCKRLPVQRTRFHRWLLRCHS